MDGYCEIEKDCHNAVQSWEGTVCINNICQCPQPGLDRECGCKPYGECDVVSGGAAGTGGSGTGGNGGGGEEPGEDAGTIIPKPECVTAQNCKGPVDAVCGAAQCVDGKCLLDIKEGPVASQVRGDCRLEFCDPSGTRVTVYDPSDVYNDGKQCTYDSCSGPGKPLNEPGWQGSTCPESKSGVCYEDTCVECVDSWGTPCPSQSAPACDGFTCVSSHCVMNAIKDGDETDVNCGGSCLPCQDAFLCKVNTDCISLNCAGTKCAAPSCSDGIKNDGETGVDCGGTLSCQPCPDGEDCELPVDCGSAVCWAGKCQKPSCEDGVKNGDETLTDCGGSCVACSP